MSNGLAESPMVATSVEGAFCGWLAPDGTYFACEPWEHESMAWRLAERYGYRDFYAAGRALDERGWVKLKSGSWIVIAREQVTQRQLDAIFDWAVSKGQTLGDVFMDEEEVVVTKLITPAGVDA